MIVYQVLQPRVNIVIRYRAQHVRNVNALDSNVQPHHFDYVKQLFLSVQVQQLKRYDGNEIKEKVALDVVHGDFLQVPYWLHLPFDFVLNKKVHE